jgi:glycosyltransferase involved in cell wall biosynthesis
VEASEHATALAGLASCARVMVHTIADMERLHNQGLADNLVLIPHGAPEPGPARPERTLLETDTITLGCCGFLLPGKGIPALVQAVGRLRARWPNVRLRLLNADYDTGPSAAEAALVRAAIQECGLDKAVELITDYLPFEEVRFRLSRCDVVVLPYAQSKEGASGALRMALGAGPCVAVTPIGIFQEAGDAVWRLPGCTPAEMEEGLACLLADRDARAFTRHAAAAWLRARHWDLVGARLAGMVRGLAVEPKVFFSEEKTGQTPMSERSGHSPAMARNVEAAEEQKSFGSFLQKRTS